MDSPSKSPKSAKMQRRMKKHKRGTSEVGRFFSNLLKTEDEGKIRAKKKYYRYNSMRVASLVKELDAEAVTAEERLSRLLHTPKPRIKLPDSGSLYDHFVVVGLPTPSATQPQILFQYPTTSSVAIPGLEDFCFPEGVRNDVLENNEDMNDVVALMHSQDYLKHPENMFVFLFTDQESQVYYGICVHRKESLGETPQYMEEIYVSPFAPNLTTRCYCLITRFPFFHFHFDFLFSLFAIDHVCWLETQAPTAMNQEDEIAVFLGSLTPDRSSTELSPRKSSPRSPLAETDKPEELEKVADDDDDAESSFVVSRRPAPLVTGLSSPNLTRFCRRSNSAGDTFHVTNLSHSSSGFVPPSPQRMPTPKLENLIQKQPLRASTPNCATTIDSGENSPRSMEEHPCIKAMEMYGTFPIPEKGQCAEFHPSPYVNPIHFTRPFFDEEEQLFAEWGLALTLHMISFETLCEFLSAILLEKKVLVYSDSLRVLSAIVLSFPPLIRPFNYQSVIIPMLPQKMENFLEAPVPYVVGTVYLPEQLPSDVVVLDVTKDEVRSSEEIADLPGLAQLTRKVIGIVEELENSFRGEIPYKTTKVQRQLVNSVSTMFETHFASLFADFHNYTICNMSDPLTPISVFMKESFLDDMEDFEIPFLEPFVHSQAFFEYSDQRLRLRDNTSGP